VNGDAGFKDSLFFLNYFQVLNQPNFHYSAQIFLLSASFTQIYQNMECEWCTETGHTADRRKTNAVFSA